MVRFGSVRLRKLVSTIPGNLNLSRIDVPEFVRCKGVDVRARLDCQRARDELDVIPLDIGNHHYVHLITHQTGYAEEEEHQR